MTFLEIINAVQQGLKLKPTSKLDMIKQMINMVYLDEIIVSDDLYPLYWLMQLYDSRRTVQDVVVTGITQADPGIVTIESARKFSEGDIVTLYNIVGMTELNARTVKVGSSGQGLTTLAIPLVNQIDDSTIDTSGFTAYESGGKAVHRGITLETEVQRILHVEWWNQPNDEFTDITFEQLKESTTWWSDQTSRPKAWMHRTRFDNSGTERDQLWWWPGADAGKENGQYFLQYWAESNVAELSADSDVPLIPARFHRMMVSGCIARMNESDPQVEASVVWPTMYAAQLNAFLTHNRKYWQDHRNERRLPPYLL